MVLGERKVSDCLTCRVRSNAVKMEQNDLHRAIIKLEKAHREMRKVGKSEDELQRVRSSLEDKKRQLTIHQSECHETAS